MTGVRCVTCMDQGKILGSLPSLPTSAPLQLLTCPKRCNATRPPSKQRPPRKPHGR